MMARILPAVLAMAVAALAAPAPDVIRDGYTALFDGTNLDAWKVEGDAASHWKVADGIIRYDGKGGDLWTKAAYRDFALWVDWRLPAPGDSGIYLRGSSKSQVNIWVNELGSGEVYGYRVDGNLPEAVRKGATPSKRMDRPVGEWNRFFIIVQGDRLTVELNGTRVIDRALLPGMPATGPIALQNHGNPLEFRNVYIKELPADPQPLWNGKDLAGWKLIEAKPDTWTVRDGELVTTGQPVGYIRTEKTYTDYFLEGEWCFIRPGQTGLLIHTREPDRVWPKSHEVQLDHTSVGNFIGIGGAKYEGGRRTKNAEKT
ncbi:MAG: DUF1080 domain-containing protein, partial [Planctomycetes bacterium]|nr:DUF1080 domain-containing protein [Planctomycetota bacterium]